ncbi:MAG: PilZ domain-containing protein [Planctomycetota bacterium]|jgi:c-di-GMP-binding flagellar brake protein YcgR
MSVDHRVFYRLAIRLPVSYQFVAGTAKPTACTGSTLNLSAGGMLLQTPQPEERVVDDLLEDRSRIELEVRLGGRQLNILSKLVWLEPTGTDGDECQMGLRFLDLDTQEQEHIWDFVLQNKAG